MGKKIRVQLKKSLIGRTREQQSCVRGLGLKKIRQQVELVDTPCVRGMINKVNFMLEVENI